MDIYGQFFADQELDELLMDAEFPPGSALANARARLWEGNYKDTASLVAGGEEPWASLILAESRIRSGQPAQRPLLTIAEDAWKESRPRLWAWTALRKLGEKPSAVHAGEVLGVVVEVPVDGKLDVLAAYADGSARYLGTANQLIAKETGGKVDPLVAAVIGESYPLLSTPPAARDLEAPPPPPDQVRFTALSPNGLHSVLVPWSDVEEGGKLNRLFDAAIALLQDLTA